jgi:hypothetical protein
MDLPITLTITERGVTINHRKGVQSMSRFSDRAQRLTQEFGVGDHTIATMRDWCDIPIHVQYLVLGVEPRGDD